MQSFLLLTTTHKILVDTCVGDHKKRWRAEWNMTNGGSFLRRLGELRVAPEEIDYVVCTHMHADHVGWNTRLEDGEWVPTFRNATYVFTTPEWLSWKARHDSNPIDQIGDSVLPVIAASRAKLVDSTFQISDEVRLEPTPGHTPGHVSVRVSSDGAHAVITGDVLHHPVQCREPTWFTNWDLDPDLASRTRNDFLAACSRESVLVCATHFPSPSFGHIVRAGDTYDFVFDDAGERAQNRVPF